MKFIESFVLIAVLAYSGFAVLLYVFQSHLIFFPVREYLATPEYLGLQYEEVTFPADDGTVLTGWFVPADVSDKIILFCHGNAGNISHRLEYIRIFNALGHSIFLFDYRGYGKSEGRLSEIGTYQDALGAWNFLVNAKGFQPESIIIYGRSLGGAIASRLAQVRSPAALVLDSVFTSVKALGSQLYPYLPIRWLSRYNYNTVQHIEKVTCPVLIIHSRNDDIVPFEHGKKLFEALIPPKKFLEISGSHNEGFLESLGKYRAGLQEFFNTLSE
jgi:fermentation-respiration switch protein FrsA (DUF1100 family)